MFERSSGLNVLLDEIQLNEPSWSPAPRQVSIALTNACDLDCDFCYAPKFSAALDPRAVRSWLDELDQGGCLGVGFGGGEPTLFRGLPELCDYGANSTGLAITLTTHGHRLTHELVDRLAGNVHFLRLSMDGVEATYEAIRQRPFGKFLDVLERTSKTFPVGLNFVVNSKTVHELSAAASLAARSGVRELLLLPETPVGTRPGIDEESKRAMLAWVSDYKGDVALSISEPWADAVRTAIPLPMETGTRSYVHVDASGSVRSSSFEKHGVPIDERGLLAAVSGLGRVAVS